MGTAFFFYTSVIICIAIVACSVSLVVWLMTSRRDCLIAAAGFALYALGMAMIFYDEYLNTKNDYSNTFELPLTHPFLTTALGIAVVACIWIWTLMRFHVPLTAPRLLAFLAPFALGCFALVPRSGLSSPVQQWLYWIWRDLGVAACLAFAAWRYRCRATKVERLDMDRSRRFFFVACVLICCVIFEDTFMIMLFRPTGGLEESTFFWYLGERNISESVLMVACGVQLLVRYRGVLAVYARHPRTEDVTEGEMAVPLSDLASRLTIFGDAKGLSRRELEVVDLVVRGTDAQNIASELVIAPGTVKAHLSRIYKKAGVSSREGLVEEFWRQ